VVVARVRGTGTITYHEHDCVHGIYGSLLVLEPNTDLRETVLPSIAPFDASPNLDFMFGERRFLFFQLAHEILNELIASFQ
jgi:hypothetical protein